MLQLLQMIGSGSAKKLYADDVFSTYLYTGNGSTQTINNGIGGDRVVWTKSRSNATAGLIYCTAQGVGKYLVPSSTNGLNSSYPNTLTAFNLNSFSLGADDNSNASGSSSVAWTFADAPKFHAHDVVTKSAGSNAAISFPELENLGMVRVKRTDASGSWYVWHRSLSAGQLLIGDSVAAAATLGHITVSGTTVTLVNGVIADGTYLVEAFAHDPSAEGLIQCGIVSGAGAVNLGFEPQYLLSKESVATGDDWRVWDSVRGMTVAGSPDATLRPNNSGAETSDNAIYVSATGFAFSNLADTTRIFLAIPRGCKPPTTGTEVYNASTASGVVSAGFPVDLHIGAVRAGAANNHAVHARLTGGTKELVTSSTAAEATITDLGFDSMTGLRASLSAGGVNHFFRRAAGFMDVVCYTYTSNVISNHSLFAVPELMIFKNGGASQDWYVWHKDLPPNTGLVINSPAATFSSIWIDSVTSTTFRAYLSGGSTYVAILFATLAGISKVGSYMGNGTSQTIDCGFGTGARFFLVKATSTTGSWWIFDSVRGIISAADPALQLNSTSAETTSADAVDPTPVGIIVNQEATCSINMNGVSYAYLAIA